MKTILLVEDEAIIAMTEANTLKKHGFEVITVYNAEKAIEAVQKHPIDLILMDIDLGQGKMDGTESAQIILKKHELPIVFLTSHTEKEIVDKVKGITRYGYVVKNSGEFVLIESINMAFELFNANQNIREREQRYRSLFFNNHSPMLLIRPSTGEIIEANPAACEFYRWTKEELTRMKIQDINQLSNVEVFQEMQKAEEEKRNTFYFKHRLADGTIRDVEVRASPISIQGEDLLYSIVNDITEKREAEANLQITLDSIGDAVISTDLNERIVQMNPVAETLTGWKRTEAVGEKVHDVFYIVNSSHEVLENPVNTVLTKGTIVELGNHTKLISRDGTEHHIADSAAPIQDSRGKIKGVVLVFRDVTDSKRAEQKLQESEQWFRNIYEKSSIGIEIYDPAGELIHANQACLNLFGVSDISQIKRFKLFDDPNVTDEIKAHLREGKDVRYEVAFDFEKVRELNLYETSKRGYSYLDVRVTPLIEEKEKHIYGYLVQVIDITEGKRVEEELKQYKVILDLIEQHPSVAIVKIDNEFRAEYVSPSVKDVLGYSPDFFIGSSVLEVVHPEDKPRLEEEISKSIEKRSKLLDSEYRVSTQAGGIRWMETKARLFYDEHGQFNGAVYVQSDVTDRKN